MPDAVWVSNIFGRNSLKKEVAVISWRTWPMRINLPDLSDNFSVSPLNEGNKHHPTVSGRSFDIRPGTYLVVKGGVTPKVKGTDRFKNIVVKEFAAPTGDIKKCYLTHSPPYEWIESSEYRLQATVVTAEEPESVEISVYGRGWRPNVIQMNRTSAYQYEAIIPKDDVLEGFLRYYIIVRNGDKAHTFPSGVEGTPNEWDFVDNKPYEVRILKNNSPLYLFDGSRDEPRLSRQWLRTSSIVPLGNGRTEVRVKPEKLFTVDPENADGDKIYDYSMRFYCGDKVVGRVLSNSSKIVLHGHSLNEKTERIQIALVSKNGVAYGGIVNIAPQSGDYELKVQDLKKVKLVTLPRPYPTFLSYFFEGDPSATWNLADMEALQISIGPGIPETELEEPHGVAIESIRLE
jgi:hypothetical protein